MEVIGREIGRPWAGIKYSNRGRKRMYIEVDGVPYCLEETEAIELTNQLADCIEELDNGNQP